MVQGIELITIRVIVRTVYDAGSRMSVFFCNLRERLLILRNKCARHVARVEGEVKCMQCCVGETLGNRPLGWSRRRWKDDFKMDLKRRMERVDSISLRIGTCGMLLWVRWWKFGFHKIGVGVNSFEHSALRNTGRQDCTCVIGLSLPIHIVRYKLSFIEL
jgi:hypothetical protein